MPVCAHNELPLYHTKEIFCLFCFKDLYENLNFARLLDLDKETNGAHSVRPLQRIKMIILGLIETVRILSRKPLKNLNPHSCMVMYNMYLMMNMYKTVFPHSWI